MNLDTNDSITLGDAVHELFTSSAWLRIEELVRYIASGTPELRAGIVSEAVQRRLETTLHADTFKGTVHRVL